jgi:hypothetical protein
MYNTSYLLKHSIMDARITEFDTTTDLISSGSTRFGNDMNLFRIVDSYDGKSFTPPGDRFTPPAF